MSSPTTPTTSTAVLKMTRDSTYSRRCAQSAGSAPAAPCAIAASTASIGSATRIATIAGPARTVVALTAGTQSARQRQPARSISITACGCVLPMRPTFTTFIKILLSNRGKSEYKLGIIHYFI